MKLTKETAELMYEMEYLIARTCYNENSYNGYTQEEGCSFRYPVWIKLEENSPHTKYGSHWGRLRTEDIFAIKNPKMATTMYYKMGSNKISIGKALKDILEMLEQRYDLDFCKLEAERKKKDK